GAAVVASVGMENLTPGLTGVVDPAFVRSELLFLSGSLLLPLLALIFGRLRPLLALAAILAAVMRLMMIANPTLSPVVAAGLTTGASLLYLALLIRHRASSMPFFFLLGLGFDQLLRAMGNTLDPSWSASSAVFALGSGESVFVLQCLHVQIVLTALAVILSSVPMLRQTRELREQEPGVSPDRGLLPVWGGIGLGALLFLQVSLLGLPNAVAGRAGV